MISFGSIAFLLLSTSLYLIGIAVAMIIYVISLIWKVIVGIWTFFQICLLTFSFAQLVWNHSILNSSPKEERERRTSARRKRGTLNNNLFEKDHQLRSSYIMTSYCRDLVEDFEQLVVDLKPSRNCILAERQAAHEVFQLLKRNCGKYNIRIARTIIAGSIGKDTCIAFEDNGEEINPDVDCVALINDMSPPFDDALEAFGEILEDHPSVVDISVGKYSVHFEFEDKYHGNISFDLLPAVNFVDQQAASQDIPDIQGEGALQELSRQHGGSLRPGGKLNPDINKLYSSSFCEKTVQFIRRQVENEFVLHVVRLAKFWNACIDMEGFVPSRSCIIELIAIDAQQGRRTGRSCIISGFRRFLEKMANFRNVEIRYSRNRSREVNEALQHFSYGKDQWFLALKQSMPKNSIKAPLIVDPGNPFNNLAHRMLPNVIKTFERQAKLTLKTLDELRNRDGYESVENAIDAIFWQK